MNKIKNTKGITLVSLVVTIIILLILSGITIATLMGNNGLIFMANKAKKDYEYAKNKENNGLENLYSSIMVATGDTFYFYSSSSRVSTWRELDATCHPMF